MVVVLSGTSSDLVAESTRSTAALASTLYGLVAPTRDSPPGAIRTVAGGILALSSRLRELRNILLHKADGQGHLFRSGLSASVNSLAEEIQAVIADIRELVGLDDDDEEAHVAERRPSHMLAKASAHGILRKIDSLNLAVGLVSTIMSLVWEQEMRTAWGFESNDLDEEDERRLLQTQAETLIQAIKQFIRDASCAPPRPMTKHAGTQTNEAQQRSSPLSKSSSSSTFTLGDLVDNLYSLSPTAKHGTFAQDLPGNGFKSEHDATEVPREEEGHASAEQHSAKWLYAFVFEDPASSRTALDCDLASTLVLSEEDSRMSGAEVIDKLLRSWSRLSDYEIRELWDLASVSSSSSNTEKEEEEEDIHKSLLITRDSVHEMVSKALSYQAPPPQPSPSLIAQIEVGPDPGNDGNDNLDDAHYPRPRNSTDQKLATHSTIDANKVTEWNDEPNQQAEPQQHQEQDISDSECRRSPPPSPPPLTQQQHTSGRHRLRPVILGVLGHRRARSRSSEGRAVSPSIPTFPSTTASASASASSTQHHRRSSSSSRSRLVGWRSAQQPARQAPDTFTSSSLPSSSSSTSDNTRTQHHLNPERQRQRQSPRVSQYDSPPTPTQKVVFSTPVVRFASSCSSTITTTADRTTCTARRLSTASSASSSLLPHKGILKTPTPQFPEEADPIREGVAPHKSDRSKQDAAPPGAKWTKIKRSWVNPEALTVGKERFEVLGDHHVKVLRVLDREEIEAYRIATAQLRAARAQGQSGAAEKGKEGNGERGQVARGTRESSGSVVGTSGHSGTRYTSAQGGSYYSGGGGGGSGSGRGSGFLRTMVGERKGSLSPRRRRDSGGDVPCVSVARSRST